MENYIYEIGGTDRPSSIDICVYESTYIQMYILCVCLYTYVIHIILIYLYYVRPITSPLLPMVVAEN